MGLSRSQVLRLQCRRLRWLIWAMSALLALSLVLAMLVAPLLHVARGGAVASLWPACVQLLPALAYGVALFGLQRALAHIAAGGRFPSALAQALRWIGGSVVAGALLSVFAVTNLGRWLSGGQGGYAFFDLSGMVLAMLGAVLWPLAAQVERWGRMQQELDEMV